MQTDYIEKILESELSKQRFFHTIGVKNEAMELAGRYNLNIEKAKLAGLLHDCAKCLPNEELKKYFKENDEELKNYKTLHAPVGAIFAKEKFHIRDEEIINAIKFHTMGRVNMTSFEKIIFLADKIEKNTRNETFRNEIIKILDDNKGETGLNIALLKCFGETIKSLVERKLYICKTTIDVYNWLLDCA